MANYNINNLPYDLPELLNSSSDPDLSTIFDDSKKRVLFFYPIHSLYKENDSNKINFAPNIVKIGFLDIDEQKQAIAYEVTNFKSQLKASNLNDSNDNPITQFNYIDQKQLITQNLDLLNQFKLYAISINNPVTEANIDNLYLLNYYEQPYQGTETISTKTITITKIKDFTTNGGNPMIIKLQKPLDKDTQITGIKIKAPRTALFGNIKVLGEVDGMEVYPELTLKDDKVLFPLLTMPIETEPKVRVLEPWFTDMVLPWDLAKQFIEPPNPPKDWWPKNALDLLKAMLKIDKNTVPNPKILDPKSKTISKARITKATVACTHAFEMDIPDKWPVSTDAAKEAKLTNPNTQGQFDISDKKFFAVASYAFGSTGREFITTPSTYDGVDVEIYNAPPIDSLHQTLLNMLTNTYSYNSNFENFSASDLTTPIADLRAKFENQKPDIVITNVFKQWELDYPEYVNLPQVQIFKQVVVMLSKYIYSSMSINKGLNDDYKLLLPYYFELKSKPGPDKPDKGDYKKFNDVEVILKSEYFDFTDPNNIKLKNNYISQNKFFQLDDNKFNWLALTNTIESNNIPSLIPNDWTLSNSEYTKYFTNFIIDTNEIEKALSLFGAKESQLYSKLELFNKLKDFKNNIFTLIIKDKNFLNFSQLEISGIFCAGTYDLTLINNDKEIVTIKNVNLFDKEKEKNSYTKVKI